MPFWQRRKFESGTKTKQIQGFITYISSSEETEEEKYFLQELVKKISKSIKGHKVGKTKQLSINIFFD